jgi:RNA polymerase sigma factor (sigma-70 family)
MFFKKDSGRHSETSDEALIALYKTEKEIDHLATLYNRYLHYVYGVALKYLRNKEDAQDAVMEVFEKLPDLVLRHEINNFNSWLYTVSKNHCLMRLRSEKKQPFMAVIDNNTDNFMESDPSEHLWVEEEKIKHLESCMEVLKDEQKTCVRLFFLEKKSYQEICEVTGYDLKSVKSHIQNGKRNLKICIESKHES